MRKSAWWVLVILLAAGMLLAGCGGGGNESAAPPQEEAAQSETAAGTEVSPDDVLVRFQNIPGVYFEAVMQDPAGEGTITSKTWQEKENSRTEMEAPGEGGSFITIVRGDENVVYMYYPEQNMAMKMDMGQAAEAVDDPMDELEPANLKYLGRETVDGKKCVVYQTGDQNELKVWLWEEHGFPVRMEVDVDGKIMVVEYRNIKIGDIPDDMFELPAGVEITQF